MLISASAMLIGITYHISLLGLLVIALVINRTIYQWPSESRCGPNRRLAVRRKQLVFAHQSQHPFLPHPHALVPQPRPDLAIPSPRKALASMTCRISATRASPEIRCGPRLPDSRGRGKYREVFQEETRSRTSGTSFPTNRLAAAGLAEGELSQRARDRAREIARDADLRLVAPRDFFTVSGENVTTTTADRNRRRKDSRRHVNGLPHSEHAEPGER